MNIALVESDRDRRESWKRVLEEIPECAVVLSCEGAATARQQFHPGAAEVFLVSLELPEFEGVWLVRWLLARQPGLQILVSARVENPEPAVAALRMGALGCFAPGDDAGLRHAIRLLSSGGSPLSAELTRRLLHELHARMTVPGGLSLSARERAILGSLAEGRSYKEIASKLSNSVNTVHSHIRRIYVKLEARNRRQAIQRGLELGMVPADPGVRPGLPRSNPSLRPTTSARPLSHRQWPLPPDWPRSHPPLQSADTRSGPRSC